MYESRDDLMRKMTAEEEALTGSQSDSKLSVEEAIEDIVNNPNHYTRGKYEVLDIIEDQLSAQEFIGFLRGNIIKYNLRYPYKKGVEDLEKAEFYLKRLILKEKE